jgi:phage-related protein
VNSAASIHPNAVEWNISRIGLRQDEVDEIVDFLTLLGGVGAFLWSPHPDIAKRLFFCEKWNIEFLGIDAYSFSATFIEDVRGECASFGALIDTNLIISQLDQASSFLTNFTSNSGTYLVNSNNNLVVRSLHTHLEQIPSDSGTLYDQLSLALSCLNAYATTENPVWLTRATNYANAIVNNYYNSSSAGTLYLPHWLYDIKTNNRREDIYYTLRTLNTGEVNTPLGWMHMLWELYDRLYTITNNTQWQTLADRTEADTITAATFTTQNFIYRKHPGLPLEYPGTEIIGSATRITTGVLVNFVNVTGSSILAVQNVDFQLSISPSTTFIVEASANTNNRIIEFFVSTSSDDISENLIYRQFWRLGSATTINSRTIASYELFRWENVSWYYGVGLISGTANYEEALITYNLNSFNNVVLRLDSAAQLNINFPSKTPFKIFCKITGNNTLLRLRDGSGFYWDYPLAITDWALITPSWSQFTWSSINNVTQSGRSPNSSSNIQELRIITSNPTYIWWIGLNAPQPMSNPSVVFRAGVRDRSTGTRNLYVGDVYPANSSSLPYTPGVIPFARNIVSGVAGGLTGLPYAAYQNPIGWVEWNRPEYLANTLRFLKDSQAAYSTSIGDNGPFTPVYTWQDKDNQSFGGTLNNFGFNGFDNFETSGYYQAQIGAWLAKAWYENQSNNDLRMLAMSWLNWLDQVFATREANLPPNSFPSNSIAVAGNNPGVQALIGEAALWCNLSGGNPATTFRWIYRSITYLNNQFVGAGNPMSGSWAKDQPVFNTTLKQYYSAWHGQCITFLSLLEQHKTEITYPACSEPLVTIVSEPIPDICCGSQVANICGIGVTFGESIFESSGINNECRLDVHLRQECSTAILLFAISGNDYLGIDSSGTLLV